jgi:hypothetical protein
MVVIFIMEPLVVKVAAEPAAEQQLLLMAQVLTEIAASDL